MSTDCPRTAEIVVPRGPQPLRPAALGGRRLVELTPVALKAWHAELLNGGGKGGRPLGARSVQLAHRVLHRALADAMRRNLIPVNPATAARAPKVERKETQVWSAEEAARFLTAVADDRLAALWVLALHTGLRRGEMAGLRWKDLDLKQRTLTVSRQRTTAGYDVVEAAPKANSHRRLLLAEPTVTALERHRRRQREERLAAGPAWEDSGYLFVDELGRPYHPQRCSSCSSGRAAPRTCR